MRLLLPLEKELAAVLEELVEELRLLKLVLVDWLPLGEDVGVETGELVFEIVVEEMSEVAERVVPDVMDDDPLRIVD